MGLKGMKCWGFLTKLMKKTLGFTPCCQEMINHQAMKMFVLWSKSQAVAKLEPLDKLENCLGWMHQNISGSLQDLLDVVPTTKSLGEVCGADIQWLQGKKDRSENDLFSVRDAQKQTGYQNVWPASWWCLGQGSGGCFANHHSPFEWSPKWTWNWKMRWWKNTTVWSMKQKPSNLLTFTFRAEPRSCWVCSRKISDCSKSGSTWWKKECRAVVCGNLLHPVPGNLYASGADGILIRATLAHSPSWSKVDRLHLPDHEEGGHRWAEFGNSVVACDRAGQSTLAHLSKSARWWLGRACGPPLWDAYPEATKTSPRTWPGGWKEPCPVLSPRSSKWCNWWAQPANTTSPLLHHLWATTVVVVSSTWSHRNDVLLKLPCCPLLFRGPTNHWSKNGLWWLMMRPWSCAQMKLNWEPGYEAIICGWAFVKFRSQLRGGVRFMMRSTSCCGFQKLRSWDVVTCTKHSMATAQGWHDAIV